MMTLELEADKARLAHAILSIESKSVLAAVKKQLSGVLNLNTSVKTKVTRSQVKRSRSISKEVQDMVIGELPEGLDIAKETNDMWEDLAK